MTTPAFDAVVEAMAWERAEHGMDNEAGECLCGGGPPMDVILAGMNAIQESWERHVESSVLAAALAARSEEDCTTCGGTQTDPAEYRGNMDSIEGYPCPDCNGTGKRPGHSLLVAALVEAGILEGTQHFTSNFGSSIGPADDVRLYREVLQGDQPQ